MDLQALLRHSCVHPHRPCRLCFSNIPAGLQGKHEKAVFEKSKRWYSGSSSSSSEERKPGDQEEELKKSCVLRWSCSVSSKDGAKAQRRMESRREEDVGWKVIAKWRLRRKQTARKSWMSETSTCRDSCETLRSLRTWSRCSGTDRQKENWKEELQEIERKRRELLAEHRKMQKVSQTLQILQDKKRNYRKDAGDSEEMRMLNQENEES